MTSWGILLMAAFLTLGLRRSDRGRARTTAVVLTALVILAVGVGAV